MRQFTKKQAFDIAESGIWKDMTDEQIVKMQLYQRRLCMPFGRFHGAMEKVLGRPIFTHEFVGVDRLKQEYEGTRKAPDIEEIMDMIPVDKKIIIFTP